MEGPASHDEQVTQAVLSAVSAKPGITLAELLGSIEAATNGSVFRLIATEQIYVNLCTDWLGEPERVRIYRNRVIASFFERLSKAQTNSDNNNPRTFDLVPGTSLLWDGIRLKIVHLGKSEISLRRENGEYIHFVNADFEQFIKEGRVTGFISRSEIKQGTDVYAIAKKIEAEDTIVEALQRYEILLRYLANEKLTSVNVTDRTIRNWKKSFDVAESEYGNGLLGLISRNSAKGNRSDRFGLPMLDLIKEVTKTEFATAVKKTKTLVYGAFLRLCEERGIAKPPTYKTFIKAIKKNLTIEMVEEMDGSKVAYQESEFLDRSDPDMPIHGDRPWEYAHIDHTELDEELLHSVTGKNMGKAWITLLMDSFSRRVLAYYLTYDPPSYRSLLGVMRECARLHNRFPECVVIDNGKDLKSAYFEKLVAWHKGNVLGRPPSKPRFGAIIERLIHTINKQVIHNLRGNTKSMKNARQVTPAVDPKNLTVWNLPMLDEHLNYYLYEEYDNREHSALGRSPREEYDAAMATFDLPYKRILYDEEFMMDTLPSTRTTKATIKSQRGIKVNGYFYRSNKLRNAELYGTKVPVRYDPYNMGVIYAYVKNEWVVCLAPPRIYSLLKNRSEREMKLVFEEERQKYRMYGRKFNERAKDLALRQAGREQSEKVEEQRLRDEELRKTAQSRGGLHSTISQLDQTDKQRDSVASGTEDRLEEPYRTNKPKVFKKAKRVSL